VTLPLVGYSIVLTSTCASCVSQGRSHINMCFLCPIGSDLTSTCASCVIQGRISHQHVLPVSYRVGSHINMCFSCVIQGRISHQHVLPVSYRAGSHINMCFLYHTGSVSPSPISYRDSPMSHRVCIITSCIIPGLSYVT
jgi:hypothetical protein